MHGEKVFYNFMYHGHKDKTKNYTWASLAKRYKASVRLRFEPSNAKIERPATEPAKILLHHPL